MKITELRVNSEQLEKQDVLDMIKFARHIHVAGDGKDIDTCKKCGHKLHHIIHLRYGDVIKINTVREVNGK